MSSTAPSHSAETAGVGVLIDGATPSAPVPGKGEYWGAAGEAEVPVGGCGKNVGIEGVYACM